LACTETGDHEIGREWEIRDHALASTPGSGWFSSADNGYSGRRGHCRCNQSRQTAHDQVRQHCGGSGDEDTFLELPCSVIGSGTTCAAIRWLDRPSAQGMGLSSAEGMGLSCAQRMCLCGAHGVAQVSGDVFGT
jgi:hypothetical protein